MGPCYRRIGRTARGSDARLLSPRVRRNGLAQRVGDSMGVVQSNAFGFAGGVAPDARDAWFRGSFWGRVAVSGLSGYYRVGVWTSI